MKEYYAARAPYYDAVYQKPERREDIAFLSKHLPGRFLGRKILEVACGTGYWTQYIAPASLSMVATDLTAEPLELARLRSGTERVTFQQIDAYALSAALGRFTGAFAGLWFSHVPIGARKTFFDGLHALLEPGSRVVLIDNNDVQLHDFPITETDIEGNTFQSRQLRDGSIHRVLKNFPTEAELRALVTPYAVEVQFINLQNFWLLEYELVVAR
jgi:demethylmenaquinone methyltransferase/2-methoxy-6-polyprenyl-1,4-benzoquinol methylase